MRISGYGIFIFPKITRIEENELTDDRIEVDPLVVEIYFHSDNNRMQDTSHSLQVQHNGG